MRTLCLSTILVTFLAFIDASSVSLPPPGKSWNVLMLLPFSSYSHRAIFIPIADALAKRGHKVELLTPFPKPPSVHSNIKETFHGMDLFDPDEGIAQYFSSIFTNDRELEIMKKSIMKLTEVFYDLPAVKDLYKRRGEFDLIIIDGLFNEFAYPFLEGKTFAFLNTAGIHHVIAASMGNVQNPAYIPCLFTEFPRPYSFWNRVKNLVIHIVTGVVWTKLYILPNIENELHRHFPHLPPLENVAQNASLSLIYTHFALEIPQPLLPSQIPIGGINCREPEPMPKDLEAWIESSNTVVYFSLGSIAKSTLLPREYRDVFVEAFRRLPYKFIWKYEEDLPGAPENVFLSAWLPQQDILSHPNVKLFITHGGLLSMNEGICHSTPFLVLPLFGDQQVNAQRMVNKGFGKAMHWKKDLNVNNLMKAITEIIEQPRYHNAVKLASDSLLDQPEPPLQRAVWWIEYVLRHDGAPNLRSPAADLSWIEFLMLDVILFCHVLIFGFIFLFKKIFSFLCRKRAKVKEKTN